MSEEITVVIVDDEAASVRNLSNDLCVYSDVRILETTTSVEKARKIVIRQQPDLLFLDVEMPKMSGLDLWQNIRADVHADMRVVFYTAYDKYVLEALRASAFDYLLKPYLPEEFLGQLPRPAQCRTAAFFLHLIHILCHMFFLFRPYFFHSKICDRREWIYPPCNRRALGSKGFRESGNITLLLLLQNPPFKTTGNININGFR